MWLRSPGDIGKNGAFPENFFDKIYYITKPKKEIFFDKNNINQSELFYHLINIGKE